MNIQLRYLALIVLASIGLGAAVSRYAVPPQAKTVESTKEVTRNDVQIVTRTVTLSNGTTESTTTTTDHTIKAETNNKQSVTVVPKDWLVSGSVSTDYKFAPPTYGAQVQRRILGPVFGGFLINTKGDVGLSIGFEF